MGKHEHKCKQRRFDVCCVGESLSDNAASEQTSTIATNTASCRLLLDGAEQVEVVVCCCCCLLLLLLSSLLLLLLLLSVVLAWCTRMSVWVRDLIAGHPSSAAEYSAAVHGMYKSRVRCVQYSAVCVYV